MDDRYWSNPTFFNKNGRRNGTITDVEISKKNLSKKDIDRINQYRKIIFKTMNVEMERNGRTFEEAVKKISESTYFYSFLTYYLNTLKKSINNISLSTESMVAKIYEQEALLNKKRETEEIGEPGEER